MTILSPSQLAEMYARNNEPGRSLAVPEVNLLFGTIEWQAKEIEMLQDEKANLVKECSRLIARVNRMVASADLADLVSPRPAASHAGREGA